MSDVEYMNCPACKQDTPYEGPITSCQHCGSIILNKDDLFDGSLDWQAMLDQEEWLKMTSEEKSVEALVQTWKIYKEIENMDDDALVDELLPFLSTGEVDFQKKTEKSLFDFTLKGKLRKMERATLEGAYVLCHCHCALSIEGDELYHL